MKPIDPADAHLKDSVVELRIVKTAIVVFLLALASVFYAWQIVFALFAVVYLGYKFHYYRERVGAFTTEDLPIRHSRLEYATLLLAVSLAGAYGLVQTVFLDEWDGGGPLSLPIVDFTDLNALLDEPSVILAWATIVTPMIILSYTVYQLRHRLLFGLESQQGAVRATVWETLARLPVFLVWIAVLSMGPVYDVWKPAAEELGGLLGSSPQTTGEFSVIYGEGLMTILAVGFVLPAVAVISYVSVQLPKYEDATIPELFGYRGFGAPNWQFHITNIVVPAGVFVGYSLVILGVFGVAPIAEPWVPIGIVISVVVGANVMGKTTELIGSLPGPGTKNTDAVVGGFVVGLVAVFLLGTVITMELAVGGPFLLYPVGALPVTYLGNRAAGKYTETQIEEFVDAIEEDPNQYDEETVGRLFVYSRSRDDTLRAAAIDGLASAVKVSSYQKLEALDVFARAIQTKNNDVVRSGLRGLVAIMSYDHAPEVQSRLEEMTVGDHAFAYLDTEDAETRRLATVAAAKLSAGSLDTTEPLSVDEIDHERTRRMGTVVEDHPDDDFLVSSVIEYYAALWYKVALSNPTESDMVREEAQYLLGELVTLPASVDWIPRMKAAIAVASGRAVADDQRLDLAMRNLDSETEEVRYIASHVLRSSMDRHMEAIDGERLVTLLEDPSPVVSKTAAEAIVAYVSYSPEQGMEILDDLVAFLQDRRAEPRMADGAVIRALGRLNTGKLLRQESIPETVAAYVHSPRNAVAEPAASLLAEFVTEQPLLANRPEIADAIDAGLTHTQDQVRLHSLRAVVAVVDDSLENGRQFVPGLADNLALEGQHSVLASVSLVQVIEEFPDDGLEILDQVATGLENMTPIDRKAVPFIVRGDTVNDVTVDIIANVITIDSSPGVELVQPLVNLVTTAEGTTLKRVFEILAILSAEFPAEARPVVEDAAQAIQEGRVGIRAAAANVLGNIAVSFPENVEPFVDRLLVATDDDSPRVRSLALRALTNVCSSFPGAIETDVHRVIGRLDDDSAEVREQAARLIVTIADQEPDIIEPAAETADRLRRLQRDPAVEFDSQRLQDASVAIQTGVTGASGTGDVPDASDLQTHESSDEMGVSGDTNIFDPSEGDFGGDFDAEGFTAEDSDTLMEPGEETIEAEPIDESTTIEAESTDPSEEEPDEEAEDAGADDLGPAADLEVSTEVPDIDIEDQASEAAEEDTLPEEEAGGDGGDGDVEFGDDGDIDDGEDDDVEEGGGVETGQESDEDES